MHFVLEANAGKCFILLQVRHRNVGFFGVIFFFIIED